MCLKLIYVIFLTNLSLLFFSCGRSESKADKLQNNDEVIDSVKELTDGFLEEDFESSFEMTQSVECKTHDDCQEKGNGFGCDCHNKCVKASCIENKNCGSDKYCDPCDFVCKTFKEVCEPCNNDYECNFTGSACLDFKSGGKFCGRGCISTAGCDKYYDCLEIDELEYKQCIPKSLKCEQPAICTKDTECQFGEVCNIEKGLCYEGCKEDIECGQLVCSAGHCAAPCNDETNPCELGQICEKGHCKIPGGCLTPYDCHEPETYCDPEENKCKSGCMVDFDCKSSAKMCTNEKCVDKGCTGNFECAFAEVCELQTGKCIPAEGKYCEPCDQNEEDPCGDEEILCIAPQDSAGEEHGSFCMPPCSSDPLNPCPQGWQCVEVQDSEGNFLGNKCVRFCYIDPVGQA